MPDAPVPTAMAASDEAAVPIAITKPFALTIAKHKNISQQIIEGINFFKDKYSSQHYLIFSNLH